LVGAVLTCRRGSFNIGYIYSFVAAGVFYWGFNRFFPHTESMLDHPETGEDVVATVKN
jgi:NCS1 family nucleobase:cation symporter-1